MTQNSDCKSYDVSGNEKISKISQSYKRTRSPESSHHVPKKFAGLQNIGNSCYLNAVLRCFIMSPIFVYGILDFVYLLGTEKRSLIFDDEENLQLSSINKKIREKYKNKIYKIEGCNVLNEFIEMCYKILLKQITDINPIILIQSMETVLPSYKVEPNIQQDAHEFLCHFLEALHIEMKMIPQHVVFDESKIRYFKLNTFKTFIESFLQTTLNRKISCFSKSCNYSTDQYEEERIISLDITSINDEAYQQNGYNSEEISKCDIKNLLDHYFEETEIAYRCGQCGHPEVRLKREFIRVPQILLLHLKRFVYDKLDSRQMKNRKYICIPDVLSLDHLLKNASYRIKGVVAHIGDSVDLGHYISYIKNYQRNYWTCWSDTDQKILKFLPENAMTDGYILFYERHIIFDEIGNFIVPG